MSFLFKRNVFLDKTLLLRPINNINMYKKLLLKFSAFLTLSFFNAQTTGMIVEPATGASALVLDPNSNGFKKKDALLDF